MASSDSRAKLAAKLGLLPSPYCCQCLFRWKVRSTAPIVTQSAS